VPHLFHQQTKDLLVGSNKMTTWENAKWQQANVCSECGMVITNRWTNHVIYKECQKELSNKATA